VLIHTPSGAHFVTLQNYFSHPSLVIYFFLTPSMKLILGQPRNCCCYGGSISAFGIAVGAKMVVDKFKIKILLSQLRK
jgi:hypothetical protein